VSKCFPVCPQKRTSDLRNEYTPSTRSCSRPLPSILKYNVRDLCRWDGSFGRPGRASIRILAAKKSRRQPGGSRQQPVHSGIGDLASRLVFGNAAERPCAFGSPSVLQKLFHAVESQAFDKSRVDGLHRNDERPDWHQALRPNDGWSAYHRSDTTNKMRLRVSIEPPNINVSEITLQLSEGKCPITRPNACILEPEELELVAHRARPGYPGSGGELTKRRRASTRAVLGRASAQPLGRKPQRLSPSCVGPFFGASACR
jgi:hypothetical protein